ncbi:MAG TPA: hypothetical protein PKH33_00140 [bacterium]|nr:hypothetical protein [bacterium]
MKKSKTAKYFLAATVVAIVAAAMAIPSIMGQDWREDKTGGLPGPGNALWNFSLPTPGDEATLNYLGLPKSEEPFRLTDIKADLLLVEIISVYCVSCHGMAPYMNKLYDMIESDADLRGRVKMIAVGAGNNVNELAAFRREKVVQFPLFPDENFEVHAMAGDPRTPFLIFARPDGAGGLTVVDTHLGLMRDEKKLYESTRAALIADLTALAAKAREIKKADEKADLKLPVTDEELQLKVEKAFSPAGSISELEKIALPVNGEIFIASSTSGKVFARVIARRIPCNDCHNVFFVYSFDEKGKFIGFEPVYLSKLGNKPWDESDAEIFRQRVAGRQIERPLLFDPKADAVTSATITSMVIFNTFNRTKYVLDELREEGYIK